MKKLLHVLLACAISAGALGAAALPAAAQVYGGAYVQFGPPAPVYETVPVSPGPNYYWIPGYYRWNGYRYVWSHGYYGYRPYSGAVCAPDTGATALTAGSGIPDIGDARTNLVIAHSTS